MRVHEFAIHHVTALIGYICCRNMTFTAVSALNTLYDHWFVIILISKFCEFADKHFLITHINLLLHAILKNILALYILFSYRLFKGKCIITFKLHFMTFILVLILFLPQYF